MSVRQDPQTENWYYRFWRGRSYYNGGFRTFKEARDAEQECLAHLKNGGGMSLERSAKDLTLAEAGLLFLENHSMKHKRSWKGDRARIGVLCRFFGKTLMKHVMPEDVERFLDFVQHKQGIKDLTRNHNLALVKAIYNRLKKWRRYFGENPACYVEMKKVPRARVRFLYVFEEKQLTPFVSRDRIVWPYYVVALHTGMRVGEIDNMRVEDIDFSVQRIFIPNSKSKRSRHVPMSQELVPFLKRCTEGKKPAEFALAGVTRSYVSRLFRRCCLKAGIADFKFHDLRHTFTARLLNKGVPIYKVSKILGHSSVVVTEQHYGHLALADLKEAIDCIDGVVTAPFAVAFAVEELPLKSETDKSIVSHTFGEVA